MSYTPKNPNGQDVMADSSPVVIASDQSAVPVSGTITAVTAITNALPAGTNNIGDVDVASLPNGLLDSFGHIITAEINNDIDVQFYRATSDSNLSNIITETETSGGTCSRSNGMATFAATTTGGSRAKGVSLVPVVYTAGAEVYAIFTAAFPTATGGTGSYRRIGLYNDLTDGLFIGYETTGTFSLSIVKGGVQTTTLKANFSADTLVGGAGSKFTRAGTPEAIDLTKLNVFRVRFGWVGSAPLKFEVLSPDGEWVLFHAILQPNLAVVPSLNTADLSFTCDVTAGTSGNSQTILSNCWGAGTTQKLRKLSDTLTTDTLAGLTRSVITGYSTAGGGAFVNVKVAPSGAMTVDASGTVLGTGTNNIGDVDVASIAAGDNNIGNVDIVSGTITTVTTLTGGGIAHDSADSGNPIKIGAKAFSPDGTTPGAVAENDRSDAKCDLNGRLYVNPVSPQLWSFHSDGSSALTDTSVQADPGDGFQIVVTSIFFSTGAATACNIFFEEGSTKVLGPWYLEAVAGRGLQWTGNKPITASTALTVTTSAAIAQSLDVCGYIQAV